MAEQQYRKRRQIREARLEIVAKYYRRGLTYRKIAAKVIEELGGTCAFRTVKTDVDFLVKEWRESELVDIDAAKTLQLSKIDERNQELWEQWEKSKTDYSRRIKKRKGAPQRNENGTENSSQIRTYSIEETETEFVNLGDVSYLSEIRQNEAERCKILGLYAAEKSEVKMTEYDLSSLTDEQRAVLLHIGEQTLNETQS